MTRKKPYAVWTKRHAAFVLLALFLAAVLIVIAAAALPYAYANATAAAQRRLPIYCTDRPGKVVSLTFDAAWGDEDTQQLIEILGKYKVRATFFVVGGGTAQDGCGVSLHNPKIRFREEALIYGAAAYASGAAMWLELH